MDRVLILDVETQGTDPKLHRVIEVGAILYSVKHATVMKSFSSLVHATENPAEAINRIPAAILSDAPTPELAWRQVAAFAVASGAIVAHNAEFDRSFVPAELRTLRPWVCTQDDIAWPRQNKPRPSLVSLALDHDLGVAYAHRALTDCDLIARLFTRAKELGADLGAMLERGLRPKALFAATAPYELRETVKAHGFQWFPDLKEWRRRMAIEDAGALPFGVRQIMEQAA